MKPWIVVLLLSVALCMALWIPGGVSSQSARAQTVRPQGKPEPSTVVIVRPRSGDFPEQLRLPGSLEPFEGEGRAGTVTQESFEPGTVTGRDVDRGIDADPPEACQVSMSSVTWRSSRPWRWK